MDFGMAVTAGIIPASKEAQKDLLKLAGGREVFKSESWWNKAVDKQISSGYRESEKGTEYMTKSGQYVLGKRTVSPGAKILYGGSGGPTISYQAPENALIKGYTPFVGGLYGKPSRPIYQTRQVDVFGASGREDFTAGELTDIEKRAKRGAERVKREAGEKTASKKRLVRGTGGLVGKARAPGDTPATGLPELGTTGLGMTAGLFGADIKL